MVFQCEAVVGEDASGEGDAAAVGGRHPAPDHTGEKLLRHVCSLSHL